MIHTGIDHHKRYSVACTVDAQGRRLAEAKIDHNSPEAAWRTGWRRLLLGWPIIYHQALSFRNPPLRVRSSTPRR